MSRIPLHRPAAVLLATMLALTGACDRGDRFAGGSGSASGEVTYASYESLESALGGEVSSEQYRKWVAAKEALDRVKNLPPPVRASGVRPSAEEIDRAVQRLERNARARQAIEAAGMTVREYVLTTLALDRAMAASKGLRMVDPAAVAAAPAPPPVDTTAYPPAYPAYQAYPPAGTPPASDTPPGYQPAYPGYPAPPGTPATPAEPAPPIPGATRPSEPVYTPVPTPRRDTTAPTPPADPVRRDPAPTVPAPTTPAPTSPPPAEPTPASPVPTPAPIPVPPPAAPASPDSNSMAAAASSGDSQNIMAPVVPFSARTTNSMLRPLAEL